MRVARGGFLDRFDLTRGHDEHGTVGAITRRDIAVLEWRMRARLAADTVGRITYTARANAVKARVDETD